MATTMAVAAAAAAAARGQGKKEKRTKAFDISRYRQRHVALRVYYEGSALSGFAAQPLPDAVTVERHLFQALLRTRLIQDRASCQYSRCGRTDRGVSACGQVVSLNLRSAFPPELPSQQLPAEPGDALLWPPMSEEDVKEEDKKEDEDEDEDEEEQEQDEKGRKRAGKRRQQKQREIREIDYANVLNKVLPPEVRVLGWTPVTDEFRSRFSASARTYRYFFVRRRLDIAAMRTAAALLVGSHDFRNLCKMDVDNVQSFDRLVHWVDIRRSDDQGGEDSESEKSVYVMEICGQAFLWHMVRCIMSVLFAVGMHHEEPDIVTELLDIERTPRKPTYDYALGEGLVLHECNFNAVSFQYQPSELFRVQATLERQWEKTIIQAAKLRNAINLLDGVQVRETDVRRLAASTVSDGRFDPAALPPPAPAAAAASPTAVHAAAAAAAAAPPPPRVDAGNEFATDGAPVLPWKAAKQAVFAAEENLEALLQQQGRVSAERQKRMSRIQSFAASHIPFRDRPTAMSYGERLQSQNRDAGTRGAVEGPGIPRAKRARLDADADNDDVEPGGDADTTHTDDFFERMQAEGSVLAITRK